MAQSDEGFTPDFFERIYTIHNSFAYAWIAYIAVIDPALRDIITERQPTINLDGVLTIDIKPLVDHAAEDPHDRMPRFIFFVARPAVTLCYEALKGDKKRYAAVERKPWFVLLGALRHALSHGIDPVWEKKSWMPRRLTYVRRLDGASFELDFDQLDGKGIDLTVFGGLPSLLDLIGTVKDDVERLCGKT